MTSSPTALLLDCFGTLVAYDARRTGPGYDQTYLYLRDIGFAGAYESFVHTWDVMAEGFDTKAERTGVEFSMEELAQAYLASYGLPCGDDEIDGLVDRYLDEWRVGISSIAGASALVADLHRDHTIVVVTNTHSTWLAESVLTQFGFVDHLDGIVTSVDHGRRKPDPSIYAAALDVAGVAASEAVFVGDSLRADYEGPRAVGISATLIDPAGTAPIDDTDRLTSILDLRNHTVLVRE